MVDKKTSATVYNRFVEAKETPAPPKPERTPVQLLKVSLVFLMTLLTMHSDRISVSLLDSTPRFSLFSVFF